MNRDARAILDRIVRAALAAVEPGQAVHRVFGVEGEWLAAGEHRLRIADHGRVVVVGAGKAAAPMAAATEEVLARAGLPVEGVVSVRYGHSAPTRVVQVREAGHPIPDQRGVAATAEMVALLDGTRPDDLVVCLLSGGGSALLTLPEEGVSLTELQATTELLLRSGASIDEVNTVRKRLDRVKGGGLARLAAPASVLTFVLSDVVGNRLDAIASGPTVADSSTWEDVGRVLARYGLEGRLPGGAGERIQAGLERRLPESVAPGGLGAHALEPVIVGSNLVACDAASTEAERLGFPALILSTYVEGEARAAGDWLAGLLREVAQSGNPLPRPCCLLAGGETTVTVHGDGLGGRNQEVALGAASRLSGLEGVLLAAIGTDGSDGPTDAAGAIVDGSTLARASALGLDSVRHLAENDAYPFFEALDDLIRTGPTNTNVNDLYVLLAV